MITPFYDCDGITLYHGDCLTVMPQLLDMVVDAVIADIPYGTTAGATDIVIPFVPMWANITRLARPKAATVLFGSEPFSSMLRISNLPWYRYDWIWQKSEGTGHLDAKSRPLKYHEIISVFGDSEPDYYPQKWAGPPNHSRTGSVGMSAKSSIHGAYHTPEADQSGMKYPRSTLYFPIVKPNIKLHESQKPVELMEYLIETYTKPGELVLDFSSGSGTTLRAAKNLKRRCIGIEQNYTHCQTTAKRLSPAFEGAVADTGTLFDGLPLFQQETTDHA